MARTRGLGHSPKRSEAYGYGAFSSEQPILGRAKGDDLTNWLTDEVEVMERNNAVTITSKAGFTRVFAISRLLAGNYPELTKT